MNFHVIVLGEKINVIPEVFREARKILGDKIIQFGYAENFEEYAQWLWHSDILPVTSIQDFFGISIVESIYCNCVPLLPERLAYPELFPREKYPECYYNSLTDLEEKLEFMIKNKTYHQIHSPGDIAVKYDWQNMIQAYDYIFESWMK